MVLSVQTVVRRLGQSQTHDPSLNPVIEKDQSGSTTGHSVASTTASSVSPKPVVQAEDVVIAGPPSTSSEPQRPEFMAALQRVLGLSDAALDELRSTDPSSASPFVSNTLCAVSASGGGLCVWEGSVRCDGVTCVLSSVVVVRLV